MGHPRLLLFYLFQTNSNMFTTNIHLGFELRTFGLNSPFLLNVPYTSAETPTLPEPSKRRSRGVERAMKYETTVANAL